MLALVVVLLAGIGYYFSSDLLGRAVPPPDLSVEVLKARPASAAEPRTVRLEPSEATERDGVFGLDTGIGHPILLFHGTDYDTVPFGDSKRFAEELPTRVTFYPVEGAGHVQSWNVDPPRYERRLNRFLVDRAGIGGAPGQ